MPTKKHLVESGTASVPSLGVGRTNTTGNTEREVRHRRYSQVVYGDRLEICSSLRAQVRILLASNYFFVLTFEQLLIDVNQMSENSKFICTATSKQMC